MKRTTPTFPRLVQREPYSVSAARKGDPSFLIERLTSGALLVSEERLFLAELAVKHVKRPRGAPWRPETLARNEDLRCYMLHQLQRGDDRENIVDDAGVEFQISRSRIYEIIKEYFFEDWNSQENER